jgi:hypothetical protein
MARTASLILDSTKIDSDTMSQIEAILYGTAGEDPRLPLPAEVAAIINKFGVLQTPDDPGIYDIMYESMVEDPEDPGTFLIVKTGVYEDPEDPGTYLTGVPDNGI